jgi:hypothetical protein
LTLVLRSFGFHGPSPTQLLFLLFLRADPRRRSPICADFCRSAPSE